MSNQPKHHLNITRSGLYLFLLGTIFLALAARFYHLAQLVPILNRDEAALAYNALLLKSVGVDEWGVRWPLVLRSFGDWKLVGYPALLVGLFSFLPAHDWLVRLPSAFAGTALVILSYFFTKKVFRWPRLSALFFALLVATSPFAIFYSRFAYEANVALFYFVLSLFLFWLPTKTVRKRLILDLLAGLIYLLAIFTYNTPFLLLPFFIGFILLERDLRFWRQWLPTVSLSLLIGLMSWWQLRPVLVEKSGVTIFTDPTIFSQFIHFRQNLPGGWLTKLFGNHYIYDLGLILQHLWASFSASFLVFAPHHPWHAVPGTGQLYLSVYLLGLIAWIWLVVSFIKQFQPQSHLVRDRWRSLFHHYLVLPANKVTLLLYLGLISLAPASVTVDAPHATRSLLFFWLWLLVVALLIHRLAIHLQAKQRIGLFFILSLVVALAFVNYLPKLFVQYHRDQVALYHAGFPKKLKLIEKQFPHRPVAIVDPDGYQYILLAWYLKLKPNDYLNHNVRQLPNRIGFRYGQQVGRYHFIAHASDRSQKEKILLEWQQTKQTWQIKQF